MQRSEAGGERARVALKLRRQVLHEVDLVDVTTRDRLPDPPDGRGVLAPGPGSPPGAETKGCLMGIVIFGNIAGRSDGARREGKRARLRRSRRPVAADRR